jgi:hypothetical protein
MNYERKLSRYFHPDLECCNDAFVVRNIDDKEESSRLKISQNENGIDVEDRIQKYMSWIDKPIK